MFICDSKICTGCFACVNACPIRCIEMVEDNYGELHPLVNKEKCIKCGICQQICPNNSVQTFNLPLNCYAAYVNNYEKRKFCASGGIGSLISEYGIITNNAHIFSTSYHEVLMAYTTEATSIAQLEHFKGSKYVYSYVGDAFQKIKKLLENEEFVIYISTPCQIAGLLSFLCNLNTDRLLTIDLICHGVCPSKYLYEEVNDISRKKGIKKITDIRFRTNHKQFSNFTLSLWNGINLVYKSQWWYLQGFLLGITLRENCYSCKYARPERISDITIGDFIGLGNTRKYTNATYNVSCIMTNTDKGKIFYNSLINDTPSLVSEERDYKERLEYGPSLRYPYPRHRLTDTFRKIYLNSGWNLSIRKTLLGKRVQYILKRFIYLITHFYMIPNKIIKKIHFISLIKHK